MSCCHLTPEKPEQGVRRGNAANPSGVNDAGSMLLSLQGSRNKEVFPNLITLPLLLIGAAMS